MGRRLTETLLKKGPIFAAIRTVHVLFLNKGQRKGNRNWLRNWKNPYDSHPKKKKPTPLPPKIPNKIKPNKTKPKLKTEYQKRGWLQFQFAYPCILPSQGPHKAVSSFPKPAISAGAILLHTPDSWKSVSGLMWGSTMLLSADYSLLRSCASVRDGNWPCPWQALSTLSAHSYNLF